ncbi:MAG TPA: RNA degradosome polyphosphate kinase, partial [Allosphingosinicella sp.]|nr:RNA degradosome polyphosphate kinase [Allosphingosinicella sp.]
MAQPAATPANDSEAAPANDGPERRLFNRELSWLAFNRRVLEEACNVAHPLLERLRFLSISGSNLDEFFMVRVAGLKGQQLAGVEEHSADGFNPGQQLAAIASEADALTASQQQVWRDLREALRGANVTVLSNDEITPAEAEWLERHFDDHISRVLTPQAIDPSHPFPFIPNKGFSLIFDLKRVSDGQPIRELLMVPTTLPRFVRLPGEAVRYMAVETIIRRYISKLFPGYEMLGGGAF